MYILGIYYFHDASAALLHDNVIVGHLEEERFNREKHTNKFPVNAINKLLAIANIQFSDINVIAISNEADKNEIILNIQHNFQVNISNIQFISCDHHIAHIYNSYSYSNFDKCASLTIDGAGSQNDSMTIAKVENNKVDVISKFSTDVSLGYLYEHASIYCKCGLYGCGKLMGLSSFGNALNVEPYLIFKDNKVQINPFYSKFFNVLGLTRNYKFFSAKVDTIAKYSDHMFYSETEKITAIKNIMFFQQLYPYNQPNDISEIIYFANFAATIQCIYNNIVLELVKFTKQQTNENNLILSGGSIQNCITNNNIIELKLFNHVYCSPTPHDAGISLGNALYAAHLHGIDIYNKNVKTSYTKCMYSIDDIEHCLLDAINITAIDNNMIVNDLIDNKIIGWFQDGAENGPRALCHRSIIANPSERNNLYRINKYIKHREEYRPLAPTIIDAKYYDIFDTTADDMSEFMLRTIKIKKEYRKKLCAVCHVDNTSRPQCLTRDINSQMYDLITTFYNKTQIPCIINTSFNGRNEPIVETINDAINMLLATPQLDYIVFNSTTKISRKHAR